MSRAGAAVVLGQHVLEHGIVPLDGGHGVVDGPPYGRLARLRLQLRPSRLGRHPEDALGAVLVGVFGVRALIALSLQLGVGLLEGVGDVLEEDQAEDDVLVLSGVHAAPKRVGHAPQLGLEALAVAVAFGPGLLLRRGHGPSSVGAIVQDAWLAVPGQWCRASSRKPF